MIASATIAQAGEVLAAAYVVSRDEGLTVDPAVAAFLGSHGVVVLTVARFLTALSRSR